MKISARDEYACAAVLDLALNYDTDTPIRVQDIAQRQGIPMKFLFQIMQILKRVDLVRSRRGTEGGYTLSRAPGQISVGDVIRAMSGPFVQLSCLESGNVGDDCDPETIQCRRQVIDRDALFLDHEAVGFDQKSPKREQSYQQDDDVERDS